MPRQVHIYTILQEQWLNIRPCSLDEVFTSSQAAAVALAGGQRGPLRVVQFGCRRAWCLDRTLTRIEAHGDGGAVEGMVGHGQDPRRDVAVDATQVLLQPRALGLAVDTGLAPVVDTVFGGAWCGVVCGGVVWCGVE